MLRTIQALAMAASIMVPAALAQVDVVESTPQVTSDDNLYPQARDAAQGEESLYPQPRGAQQRPARPALRPMARPQSTNTGDPTGDLFFQLQTLQEELMYLRGLVEEHEQTIRQLKQQRLDDYMNLDRRIAELGTSQLPPIGPGTGIASTNSTPGTATTPTGTVNRPVSNLNEDDSYRAAYELLRDRQFVEATSAFEAFLANFADAELAPNAYYWLGELYMLDGRNDVASQRFEALLRRYPENRKAPDAMFKLAKVYHLEGRNDDARTLLDRVGRQYAGSSAARLATEYLQQNF